MSRISDAQRSFLRAFRQTPSGPPPENWPSPSILRRWLRRPRFRSALNDLQLALHFQADFHIASAATAAARNLDNADAPPTPKQLESILRLSHLRQRFTATTPPSTPIIEQEEIQEASKPAPPPFIPPEKRLTDEELKKLAWQRGYSSPLNLRPDFPKPDPQDTFYFRLLQDPQALLWWMKLYDESGNDHRFSPILLNCRIIMPREAPHEHFPRFSNSISPTQPDNLPRSRPNTARGAP